MLTTDVHSNVNMEKLYDQFNGQAFFGIERLAKDCFSLPEQDSDYIVSRAQETELWGHHNFMFAAFVKDKLVEEQF